MRKPADKNRRAPGFAENDFNQTSFRPYSPVLHQKGMLEQSKGSQALSSHTAGKTIIIGAMVLESHESTVGGGVCKSESSLRLVAPNGEGQGGGTKSQPIVVRMNEQTFFWKK